MAKYKWACGICRAYGEVSYTGPFNWSKVIIIMGKGHCEKSPRCSVDGFGLYMDDERVNAIIAKSDKV